MKFLGNAENCLDLLHPVIKRSSTKPDYVKPNFHFYSEEFSKGFEGYSIIHFSSDYKSFMAKLNDIGQSVIHRIDELCFIIGDLDKTILSRNTGVFPEEI